MQHQLRKKKKSKRSVTKKKVLNQRQIETGFINLPNHSFKIFVIKA